MESVGWVAFALGVAIPTTAWLMQRWVKWSLATIADAVVESIGERLRIEELRDQLEDHLQCSEAIQANLTPNGGAWPNGSQNLPESLTEIYRRQDELSRSLEIAITSRLVGGRRWTDPPGPLTRGGVLDPTPEEL